MSDAPERCPECGSTDLAWDAKAREWVCQTCGLVLEDVGRAGEPEAPPSRPHAGETVNRSKQRLPGRLERTQQWATSLSSSERRLLRAKQEAHRLASVLGCPNDVADRAADMVKQAREADLTQGRSLDAMAAAALMAACRMLHLVRTEEQIEDAARVSFSEIQNAYKALVKGLNLPIPPVTAHEYMAQLASKLPLEPGVEAQARTMLQQVCGTEQAAGKNPRGWAAGALVLASRDSESWVSIAEAAEAAEVSEATVRSRLDELEAFKDP